LAIVVRRAALGSNRLDLRTTETQLLPWSLGFAAATGVLCGSEAFFSARGLVAITPGLEGTDEEKIGAAGITCIIEEVGGANTTAAEEETVILGETGAADDIDVQILPWPFAFAVGTEEFGRAEDLFGLLEGTFDFTGGVEGIDADEETEEAGGTCATVDNGMVDTAEAVEEIVAEGETETHTLFWLIGFAARSETKADFLGIMGLLVLALIL